MSDEQTRRQCQRVVKNVVRRMLCRNDEDVEQEIYIRLWQKYPQYHEEDKLFGWIKVVAENYCRDYLKSKSHKLLCASVEDTIDGMEYLTSDDNPERQWLIKCRQHLILEAVNELPKEMKSAIVLVEFKGLSYETAAKKLKINIGTLKSRLHNAKAKLHDKLAYLEL